MPDTPAAPIRRRPWARRTSRGTDLALAIPLFLLEAAWLVLDAIFGYGLAAWAAQGDRPELDAAALAYLGRLRVTLIAVLAAAVVAAVFRARWTAIAHLLAALLAGAALVAAQHDWDQAHTPRPGCVRYSANC